MRDVYASGSIASNFQRVFVFIASGRIEPIVVLPLVALVAPFLIAVDVLRWKARLAGRVENVRMRMTGRSSYRRLRDFNGLVTIRSLAGDDFCQPPSAGLFVVCGVRGSGKGDLLRRMFLSEPRARRVFSYDFKGDLSGIPSTYAIPPCGRVVDPNSLRETLSRVMVSSGHGLIDVAYFNDITLPEEMAFLLTLVHDGVRVVLSIACDHGSLRARLRRLASYRNLPICIRVAECTVDAAGRYTVRYLGIDEREHIRVN